jgi:hypothetical protein
MRSNEFITEAPARYDDMGQPIAAPTAPAQTPAWLKSAGNWLGKKIGMNDPVPLPDYTASNQQDAAAKSGYTGIDPVIRQRAGMAPATQQEINAYMKANPAVVKGVTDRNGNPIASGGAQEVERAARAAAPSRRADWDVDAEVGAVDPAVIGNQFKTPRELGFYPGGSTAPTPVAPAPDIPAANPMSQDPAQRAAAASQRAAPAPAPSVEIGAPIPRPAIRQTQSAATQKSFDTPDRAAAPTPMRGGYGSGMNNPSVAESDMNRILKLAGLVK